MSKAYYLGGDSYLRCGVETARSAVDIRKPIEMGWTGLADAAFAHVVDTVLDLGDGKAYLFRATWSCESTRAWTLPG